MKKNKDALGKRVVHVDEGWSYMVSQRSNGKDKLSLEQLAKINKILGVTRRECADKELEIRNAAGPASTPDRHYPKSFTIKSKEEE